MDIDGVRNIKQRDYNLQWVNVKGQAFYLKEIVDLIFTIKKNSILDWRHEVSIFAVLC